MPPPARLSGRERVQLALEHRTTDRIPVAMVCAGINPPARRALDRWLQADRGVGVEEYLAPIVDIVEVAPRYRGPALAERMDIWGVTRRALSHGEGAYDEIERYPLAGDMDADTLARHRFPDPAWFDYSTLPQDIAAVRASGDRAVMVTNGNIFETAWYMRGFAAAATSWGLPTGSRRARRR
ncbi:MAG TPA: hypothetical protein VL359_13300, partial [bacterium]|nr:hypothetical protein [bacterium]